MKKRRKSIFLNGREGLAVHRSGQGLFLPRATFENKEMQQGALPFLSRYSWAVILPPQNSAEAKKLGGR